MSQRTVAGVCGSSIGAYVVINNEGWIVTAGHVLQQANAMAESAEAIRLRPEREAAIRADQSIDEKERRRQLKSLGHSAPDAVEKFSLQWGTLPGNPQLKDAVVVNGVDLGIGRLEPFDASAVARYPTFKDPTKNFEPGTSLCKMGFPFHGFAPTYDPVRDVFEFPPEAMTVPLFPNEGMLTRFMHVVAPGITPDPDVPLMLLETSTPGLRGQSGGPTFDCEGTLWAIQVQTSSYPLDFDKKMAPQYFHVGWGVHAVTILAALNKLKIKHSVSAY